MLFQLGRGGASSYYVYGIDDLPPRQIHFSVSAGVDN
jgi:hypothetical protein